MISWQGTAVAAFSGILGFHSHKSYKCVEMQGSRYVGCVWNPVKHHTISFHGTFKSQMLKCLGRRPGGKEAVHLNCKYKMEEWLLHLFKSHIQRFSLHVCFLGSIADP